MGSHSFRQRYWARSMLGFPQMQRARPNYSHYAITRLLESKNSAQSLITQNVDSLHLQAGSKSLEMHGALRSVKCTSCNVKMDRSHFQKDLHSLNPEIYRWSQANPDKIDVDVSSSVNPDGDVEIKWDYSNVEYPSCSRCFGILKPDVVFFGENMPEIVRRETYEIVDNANVLLVIGSSLQVFSSFRLAKRAQEKGIPLVIINLGKTRADDFADLKIDAPSSSVLQHLLKDTA